MTQFDRGIAVTAAGGGVYDTEISDDWRIARGVNGGLLLALVANAVSAELGEHGHPDPVAMSAAYLGVPYTGPAQIAVDLMRNGGTYSVVRADLIQQEDGEQPSVRVAVQAVFGDLDALAPEVSTSATPAHLNSLRAVPVLIDGAGRAGQGAFPPAGGPADRPADRELGARGARRTGSDSGMVLDGRAAGSRTR